MSSQTPFAIGAIRFQENSLFTESDYTRFTAAPTVHEAVRVLSESPYGHWMADGAEPVDVFVNRLLEVRTWIEQVLNDTTLTEFVAIPYDGLNIAAALFSWQAGDEEAQSLSPLGSIPATVLTATLWHDRDWEAVPPAWANLLRELRELMVTPDATAVQHEVLARIAQHVNALQTRYARTPLMRAITQLNRDRLFVDSVIRGYERPDIDVHDALLALPEDTDAETLLAALAAAGYRNFTLTALKDVLEGRDATMYERTWDRELQAQLVPYRAEVTGYDPILAYWYTLELEATLLRLLLLAKRQGVKPERLTRLQKGA